jgi:transcriptional regulator with XRE-family HTH domain
MNMSSIGTKIRKLRESRDMSQMGLSKQLDISQTTLCNIESGKSEKIDFLLMDKVCKVFEKDPDYFLDNSVVNNSIKENKGQVCCGCNNFTFNNYCPESLLEELKKLIVAKNEEIELLKNLLGK